MVNLKQKHDMCRYFKLFPMFLFLELLIACSSDSKSSAASIDEEYSCSTEKSSSSTSEDYTSNKSSSSSGPLVESSSSETSSSSTPICVEDYEPRCINDENGIGYIESCKDGIYSSDTCENVSCNATGSGCGICLNSNVWCSTDSLVIYECKNGYKSGSLCYDGDKCTMEKNTAACRELPKEPPECEFTESKCSEDGNNLIRCLDGKIHTEICKLGCQSGECISFICMDGETRCSSNYPSMIMMCRNNLWYIEDCPYGYICAPGTYECKLLR